jgi:hypothetical protein
MSGSSTSDETRSRGNPALAIASLVFALVASVTYLGERLYERLRHGKSDPRLILGEQHALFYWRAFLAAWWGSVIAVVIYRALKESPGNLHRRSNLFTWGALLLVPLALFWTFHFP